MISKDEFKKHVPGTVEHKENGFMHLEIIMNKKNQKGACYRNEMKMASYGTYDTSWEKVYMRMDDLLKKEKEIGNIL